MTAPHDDDPFEAAARRLLTGPFPDGLRTVWPRLIAARDAYLAVKNTAPAHEQYAALMEWTRACADLRELLATLQRPERAHDSAAGG